MRRIYNTAMTLALVVCSLGFFLGLAIAGLVMGAFDPGDFKDAQAALHKKPTTLPS